MPARDRRAAKLPSWFLAAALAASALCAATVLQLETVLYNHSPSLPVGFYLRRSAPPTRGAIVTVRALDVAPVEATQRAFTGRSDRFLKRIAAVAGDEVCLSETAVIVAGRTLLRRGDHQRAPHASSPYGCRLLAPDEYFLVGDTPDSFDSRYWGAVSRDKIEGVWSQLIY